MELTSIAVRLLLNDMHLEIAREASHKTVWRAAHLTCDFNICSVGGRAVLQMQKCMRFLDC